MSVLEIKSQDFKHVNVNKINSFFRIKIAGNSFLISSHSYLPINFIKINNNQIMIDDIYINSNWNDLLIIKNQDHKCPTFDKIRKTILPNGTRFLIGAQSNFVLDDIIFCNFAMLPNYPRLMYYKIVGDTTNIKCGDPVLLPKIDLNNTSFELSGIVSYKFDNYVLCLPSYYIFKTINRSNNEILVPNIHDISKINKIDNYKVSNNYIWNKFIKFNIPIDVNFLLESDQNKIYEINNIQIIPKYIIYENESIVRNTSYLMFRDECFLLTTRLFHLLKEYSNEMSEKVWDEISKKKCTTMVDTFYSASNIIVDIDSNDKLIMIS